MHDHHLNVSKRKQEAFLKEYELEEDYWFSGHIKKDTCVFAWHNKLLESWWNHASVLGNKQIDTEKFIAEVINFFQKKNRIPAVIIPSFARTGNLEKALQNAGFQEEHIDAWMFYRGQKHTLAPPEGLLIKNVSTQEENLIFVDLFNKSHSGAPDEPYGQVPREYSEVLLQFLQNPPNNRLAINHLCLIHNESVGQATLVSKDKFAGIYNVGTIPQYRNRGVASSLTNQAVIDAQNARAEIIFLITAQGSYNEKLFAKLGFVTEFIVKAYTLNSVE